MKTHRLKCCGQVILLLILFAFLASRCDWENLTVFAAKVDYIVDTVWVEECTEDEQETEEDTEQIYLREITDLSDAYEAILQYATKDFLGGHYIDDTFLMWFTSLYGEDSLMQIAYTVLGTNQDTDVWFDISGNSIHVLWLMYCRDTGFGAGELVNVAWVDCKSENEAIISFTGDVNLAEDWYTTLHLNEQPNGIYDCLSNDLIEIMQASDILMINNEFVYSDYEIPLEGKAYTFRADLDRVSVLKELGADFVSLANNHTYDFGAEGLLDTMEVLDNAGIAYIGAGKNIEDAKKIIYYVVNGRKIAFVSATEIERSIQYTKEATENTPGVLKTLRPQKFISVIEEAAQNSDYVIAIPHWGTEGNLWPDASQQNQAKLYAEAGADVIIGGHPHRLQGVEFIGDVPVAYSLGNFWFSTGTLYTTLAQVIIEKNGDLQLKFLPCLQKDLITTLLTDKIDRDDFYRYIAAISTDVGIDLNGRMYNTKNRQSDKVAELKYDSKRSSTWVAGRVDNEGFAIDIVGNRTQYETEVETETVTEAENATEAENVTVTEIATETKAQTEP